MLGTKPFDGEKSISNKRNVSSSSSSSSSRKRRRNDSSLTGAESANESVETVCRHIQQTVGEEQQICMYIYHNNLDKAIELMSSASPSLWTAVTEFCVFHVLSPLTSGKLPDPLIGIRRLSTEARKVGQCLPCTDKMLDGFIEVMRQMYDPHLLLTLVLFLLGEHHAWGVVNNSSRLAKINEFLDLVQDCMARNWSRQSFVTTCFQEYVKEFSRRIVSKKEQVEFFVHRTAVLFDLLCKNVIPCVKILDQLSADCTKLLNENVFRLVTSAIEEGGRKCQMAADHIRTLVGQHVLSPPDDVCCIRLLYLYTTSHVLPEDPAFT